MLCPSCSSEVPERARFCPSCGNAISRQQIEERRIVTVLFADVVGFTSLAEHSDPESVKTLIDGCFQRVVDDITAFGGRIDKLLGDGLVALFGAPVAHEDDAERAVRAGLRIHQTVATYSAARQLATPLRMRIGINTGEVLTGTVAGTDYTAMGDTVNAASRVQTLAKPGTVLVGESTHALTAHTIRYTNAGDVALRGREQSMQLWQAEEATAPPGRRRRRREVGLVGRERELAVARAAFDVAFTDRRTVLVTLTGESGVGKSRVLDELIDGLGTDVSILRGTCVPYGEANAWWPLASALTSSLDIEAGAPDAEVRELAAARARRLGGHLSDNDVEQLVETFCLLLGNPSSLDRLDPATQRSLVHRAITQVVGLRAAQRPIIVAVSDLHWADQVVVDLLEHLASSLVRLPVAILTTMRPGTDLAWPPRNDRLTSTTVNLQPLSAEHTAELATRLLAADDPSPALLTALYERSGGNPLFLQELAALNDRGGRLTDLPDSLRTLIGARLDELSTDQRQILEHAATLGASGTIGSLERFARELGQPFDPVIIDELEDLGLLEQQGRRWWFRSESVRDAAYQTLTKANRAQRHAGVARVIEQKSRGALDDIAHHLATAAELVVELGRVRGVPPDIGERAIDALAEAAHGATNSGNAKLAIRHSTRALDLIVDDGHARRVELLLLRSAELIDLRAYAEAHADIDEILALVIPSGDIVGEGEARRRLGTLYHSEGQLDAARRELATSIALLRRTEHPAALARAAQAAGFIELFGGSMGDAERHFAEAETMYTALNDERGLAWIEQHRAWLSFLSGDVDVAHTRLHHAVDTLQRLGDRNGVGWAMGLLAFVEFFRCNFESAESLAHAVEAEAEERGDPWAAAMMQVLLANLHLWRGDIREGGRIAETARARLRKLGDKFGMAQAMAPVVRSHIALGETAAAQKTIEELTTMAETGGSQPVALLAIAGAAMHRGDADLAAAAATRCLTILEAVGGSGLEAHMIRAMAAAQNGDLDQAMTDLEQAGQAADLPFHRTTSAIVAALDHRWNDAITLADAVDETHGATYLDRIFAAIATAAGHVGNNDCAAADTVLAEADALAQRVGDVVAIALIDAARWARSERPDDTNTSISTIQPLGPGWRTIIRVLFAPGPAATT